MLTIPKVGQEVKIISSGAIGKIVRLYGCSCCIDVRLQNGMLFCAISPQDLEAIKNDEWFREQHALKFL